MFGGERGSMRQCLYIVETVDFEHRYFVNSNKSEDCVDVIFCALFAFNFVSFLHNT